MNILEIEKAKSVIDLLKTEEQKEMIKDGKKYWLNISIPNN